MHLHFPHRSEHWSMGSGRRRLAKGLRYPKPARCGSEGMSFDLIKSCSGASSYKRTRFYTHMCAICEVSEVERAQGSGPP